jgi:NADP-dependent 3-hydroxy acid dehydrogenase YdfG
MNHSLTNRIAIISGVTSGIGYATARTLHALGARVVGIGRDAARLAALSSEMPERFESIRARLDVPDECARAAERITGLAPGPHVLVNNAAECVYESPLEASPATLSRLLEVNVVAAMALARAAAGVMTDGGHILQLSSVTAHHVPNAKFATYAVTKSCVEQLTDALRWELHPRGIAVTTLSPGLVDTPIYDKVSGFSDTLAKLKRSVPRWLEPQDVANTIAWVLTQPQHLVISELVLLPKGQAR